MKIVAPTILEAKGSFQQRLASARQAPNQATQVRYTCSVSTIFSAFDIRLSDACREFTAVTESDIRWAHSQAIARPLLSGIPQYLYDALRHSLEQDQEAHDAEVTAQFAH